ncbi:MAG: hypothetical protein CR972_03035 [Candidatus Moraniibacteriota bacterium]|nr:MAG: hypothetical protein CR972_03035 [Candidatus Moranbacteria bacterium]
MDNWNGFENEIDNTLLADAIELFFNHAEKIGYEDNIIPAGIEYLLKKGKIALALLIQFEVIVAELHDSGIDPHKIDCAVEKFSEIKMFMQVTSCERREEISEYLVHFTNLYSEVFTLIEKQLHIHQ